VVLESAPDRPDAVAVVLKSVRAVGAPVARVALRAHAVDASRPRGVVGAAHANPLANPAAARRAGRALRARAAVARPVVGKEAPRAAVNSHL